MGDYILSLNASLSDIAAHAVANTRVPPGCFLLQDSALLRVGVSEDHPSSIYHGMQPSHDHDLGQQNRIVFVSSTTLADCFEKNTTRVYST